MKLFKTLFWCLNKLLKLIDKYLNQLVRAMDVSINNFSWHKQIIPRKLMD